VLAAQLGNRKAGLAFIQDRHDLALVELALRHRVLGFLVESAFSKSGVYGKGALTQSPGAQRFCPGAFAGRDVCNKALSQFDVEARRCLDVSVTYDMPSL
jgi:hypothetical protein